MIKSRLSAVEREKVDLLFDCDELRSEQLDSKRQIKVLLVRNANYSEDLNKLMKEKDLWKTTICDLEVGMLVVISFTSTFV